MDENQFFLLIKENILNFCSDYSKKFLSDEGAKDFSGAEDCPEKPFACKNHGVPQKPRFLLLNGIFISFVVAYIVIQLSILCFALLGNVETESVILLVFLELFSTIALYIVFLKVAEAKIAAWDSYDREMEDFRKSSSRTAAAFREGLGKKMLCLAADVLTEELSPKPGKN